MATPQPSISARSAPAISMPSRWRSPAASPPPTPCTAPPSRRSSVQPQNSRAHTNQRRTTMASISRVKERTEEQATSMGVDQQSAVRMLANDLHRLNQSVMKAVEAGVSVELVRWARHHGGDGNWGDLVIPVVVTHGKQ